MSSNTSGGGVIVGAVVGAVNFVVAVLLMAGAYSIDPVDFVLYMPGILWMILSFMLMQGSRIAAFLLMSATILLLLLYVYFGLQALLWANVWFYIVIGGILFLFAMNKVAAKSLSPSKV